MKDEQYSLFSKSQLRVMELTSFYAQPQISMSGEALQLWKEKVICYQRELQTPSMEQTNLFDTMVPQTEALRINPFNLEFQNIQFWRWPTDGTGDAVIYFVIDRAAPLLLYIGETCRSNLRWKGEHDCKRYLDRYHTAHFQNNLRPEVGIAFWWQVPPQTRPRQQLELALIQHWRSPFNKENWQFWGTPFVSK